MNLSRRKFLGLAGAAAVVAPTVPALAYQASAPGDRDATRWLQRKIDRLRPGDTLRVPPRWYRVDGTLVVQTSGTTIAEVKLYRDPPSPEPGMSIEAKHTTVRDVKFNGLGVVLEKQ